VNQAILFNDDIHFNETHNAWSFTGLMAGQKVTVFIKESYPDKNMQITDCIRFDWEEAVEIWLEQHEPDHNNEIYLKL